MSPTPIRSLHIDGSIASSHSSFHSSCTVQRHVRRASVSSALSIGSSITHMRRANSKAPSESTLDLTVLRTRFKTDEHSSSRSVSASRSASRGSLFACRLSSDSLTDAKHNESRLLDVAESGDEAHFTSNDADRKDASAMNAIEDSLRTVDAGFPDADTVEDLYNPPDSTAFRRWVSTLRRKKQQQPSFLTTRTQRWTLDDFEQLPMSPPERWPSRHQKSHSYASSAAFVTAVKSASATIASASIATISRRNSQLRRKQQQSSPFSGSDPRPSGETHRSIVDEAARQRSRKRREKVEELIRTEESYVADLKALSNACTL